MCAAVAVSLSVHVCGGRGGAGEDKHRGPTRRCKSKPDANGPPAVLRCLLWVASRHMHRCVHRRWSRVAPSAPLWCLCNFSSRGGAWGLSTGPGQKIKMLMIVAERPRKQEVNQPQRSRAVCTRFGLTSFEARTRGDGQRVPASCAVMDLPRLKATLRRAALRARVFL